MKAVICENLSGIEGLSLQSIETPTAGPGEVIVDVKYAALNFFDTLIIRGKYQSKPELPFSPGGEVAGKITEIGEGVTGVALGDRIMAYCGWGGLREKLSLNAEMVIKLPDNLDDQVAAAVAITYGTALHGLIERAKVKPGETVVVNGAAGGAGLAAIDIAKLSGAKVIAVASSKAKLDIALKRGADQGCLSTADNVKNEIKALTSGEGADIIYDCVGGELSEPSLRALKWGGRFLVVGFASGEIPALPLNLALLKGIHIQGVHWGRFIKEQPEDYAALMRQLLNWCETGEIMPHIHHIYPLDQVKQALREISERKVEGKILIGINC